MTWNQAIVWIVLGGLSGGSIVHLSRKIGAQVPWLTAILLGVAFHFWPFWYFFRYRPAKAAWDEEQARQYRHDNWAAVEQARY